MNELTEWEFTRWLHYFLRVALTRRAMRSKNQNYMLFADDAHYCLDNLAVGD